MYRPTIAVVTATTRMQGLLQRWGTKGAARFRLDQAILLQKNSAARKGEFQTATVDPTVDHGEKTFEEYEREIGRAHV